MPTKANWVGSTHNPLSCHHAKQKGKQQKPEKQHTKHTSTKKQDEKPSRPVISWSIHRHLKRTRFFFVQRLHGFRQVVTNVQPQQTSWIVIACKAVKGFSSLKRAGSGPLQSPMGNPVKDNTNQQRGKKGPKKNTKQKRTKTHQRATLGNRSNKSSMRKPGIPQPVSETYKKRFFFPSNAFMASARSLHTFDRSKR